MGNRILIVEDEERIAKPLSRALNNRGFEALVAPTGASALKATSTSDLFLVDLNLPDIDGVDLCRRLRSVTDAPIIVLSARSGVGDKVACLEIGADDFVTKPFELDELVARIRVQIRRSEQTDELGFEGLDEIAVGEVRIHPRSRRAWFADTELELSPKEFDLLLLLMQNAGEVVRRETAISRVWDEHWYGSTKTLDVHIGWLRKKIEVEPSNPVYITTVRRVGFRFASPGELSGQ